MLPCEVIDDKEEYLYQLIQKRHYNILLLWSENSRMHRMCKAIHTFRLGACMTKNTSEKTFFHIF